MGIRSRTSGIAGARWKNELPKSARAVLPRNFTNCAARDSLKPIASRSRARSDSGASGIMRATGSPLTWRIANVTSDTPASTTTSRMIRRMTSAVTAARSPASGPADLQA